MLHGAVHLKIWALTKDVGTLMEGRVQRPPVEDVIDPQLALKLGATHIRRSFIIKGGIEALVRATLGPSRTQSVRFTVRSVRKRNESGSSEMMKGSC